MWSAANIAAAAESVMAVVMLITLWDARKAKKESGMNKASQEQTADEQPMNVQTSKTWIERSRTGVALLAWLLASANLAWLEFGPRSVVLLTAGDAANIAVSLSMMAAGLVVLRS